MLGAEGVSNAIVRRMTEAMPAKIDELRRRLGVSAYELPDLLETYPTEVELAAMNHYPLASVVQTDTTGSLNNDVLEVDEEGELYGFHYRMRVYVWASADGHPETDTQRKRLALAVREVFLAQQLIHQDAVSSAVVNPKTIRESYSDVGPREAEQFLAAAYVEFEVVTQELLGTIYQASANPVDLGLDVGMDDTPAVPQP